MKFRRHHNNTGFRQIQRGKTIRDLSIICKILKLKFKEGLGMNPQPKIKPKRHRPFLTFISQQRCCLTGVEKTEYEDIIPHHQNKEGHGTMAGKCCDSRALPVRSSLHVLMENPKHSRKDIFSRYNKDPEKLILYYQDKWLKQGGKKFWDDYYVESPR